MHLASWTYTKEEWKRFVHWRNREKGLLIAFFRRLLAGRGSPAPEIRITADRVWVNQVHEPFQNMQRQFRGIHIREAGEMNIMEIRYEQDNSIKRIKVPIPKGKLREAFELQERLVMDKGSIG